jgi:hypothetical protein
MMNTIRLRTIEGRRMRDPAHPKRAAIATGTDFDVLANSPHWNHWMRRLLDGDVEEVRRKVRVCEGRKVTIPAAPASTAGKPQEFTEGEEAEISMFDPHWRAAFDRGDAELVPDEPETPVRKTVATATVNAAGHMASEQE